MKKLFLIVAAAGAFTFQACKSGTADKDNTIDDGMNTSETTIGSGSTRPSDRNAEETDATTTGQSGIDTRTDSAGTGTQAVETAPQGNKPH